MVLFVPLRPMPSRVVGWTQGEPRVPGMPRPACVVALAHELLCPCSRMQNVMRGCGVSRPLFAQATHFVPRHERLPRPS
jgi:hypothetical protein